MLTFMFWLFLQTSTSLQLVVNKHFPQAKDQAQLPLSSLLANAESKDGSFY